MSNHTPGPWSAFQRSSEVGTNYWRIRTTPDETSGDSLHGYCGEANANLIAAAPDLLESLEALVAVQNGPPNIHDVIPWGDAMLKAKLTLKKARGGKCDWIDIDTGKLECIITVTGYGGREDVSLTIDFKPGFSDDYGWKDSGAGVVVDQLVTAIKAIVEGSE